MNIILCIGTTPAVQRVMTFKKLTLDGVNRALATLDGAAGKSINVAKVLRELGERPLATGFLGGDYGDYIQTALMAKGVEMEFVRVSARTRLCVTVIDESQGTHTELVEEGRPVEAQEVQALQRIIERRISHCRAMVMSGTIAPGMSTGFYADCVKRIRTTGALSVVDAQKTALIESLSARPGLVKPNRAELADTVGREMTDESAVMLAMRELHERGAERLVVTAGKEPALAFDGRSFWRLISPPLMAVNPIGSGDAFTAGLVWRLLAGDDLGEACRWGSAAGAANALTPMAGEVRRSEVYRLADEVRVERLSRA